MRCWDKEAGALAGTVYNGEQTAQVATLAGSLPWRTRRPPCPPGLPVSGVPFHSPWS